jgi:hypothetical protein
MKTMRVERTWREAEPAASARRGAAPTLTCRVCGSVDVTLDEVADDGRLLLGECAHCDHRWTERALLAVAFSADEVAEAA